jgi:hypothetical protein
MPFPLRILCNGLIGCIRRTPAGKVDLLLVDARHPTRGQLDVGMHPHQPFLAVRADALSTHPDNRQPDRYVPGIDGDILALFHLSRDSREVLQIATHSPLDLVRFPVKGAKPETEDEAAAVDWIVSLEKFNSGVDKLDPACFGDLGSGPVAARLEIAGGKVFCQRLIRRDGDFQVFEFRVNARAPRIGERQALCDVLAVEMDADPPQEGGEVRITSSSRPALELVPPPAGGRVDVVIGNLHLHHHAGPPEDTGTHFRWYYELLKDRPPLLERPIPFAAALGSTTSFHSACPQMAGGLGGVG